MFYRDTILHEDSPIAEKKTVTIYPFRAVGNIRFGQSRQMIRNALERERSGTTLNTSANPSSANGDEGKTSGGYKGSLQKPTNNTTAGGFNRIKRLTKRVADRFDSYKIYYDEAQKCNKIEVELNGPFSFRLKGRVFEEDYLKNKKTMLALDPQLEDKGGSTVSKKMGVTLTRSNTLIVYSRDLVNQETTKAINKKNIKAP